MFIYKVVQVRQKTMSKGYLSAAELQNTINSYAEAGWTLDRITSGEIGGLTGADVFLLIFRAEVVIPADLVLLIDNQQIEIAKNSLYELRTGRKINGNTPAIIKGASEWQSLEKISPSLVEYFMN